MKTSKGAQRKMKRLAREERRIKQYKELEESIKKEDSIPREQKVLNKVRDTLYLAKKHMHKATLKRLKKLEE